MNLPQFALRRPLSIVAAAIAVGIASLLGWQRMSKDILPVLNLPTIYVAQAYGGMDPAQMEGYLVYFFEYHFLYLTGIEHVESKSIQGAALMKLEFHPGTDMSQAMAETVAYVNRARAFMPAGTMPPLVTRFDAGSVPVGYLVFSSKTRSVEEIQDEALNRVRPLLATLPGVSSPPPFGGNARSIVVMLKPDRLKSYGMSPDEVVRAVAAANVVSPSGNFMIEGKYPMVPLNSVARTVKEFGDAPIRGGMYPAVFVRDVAEVKDDSDIVTGYAMVNGQRTVYIPITKRADASALAVATEVKNNLSKFQGVLPSDVRVDYILDQSSVITQSLAGLLWEGIVGAALTGLTILLFLHNWRSSAVMMLSIPLSLMAAALVLWLGRQTVNLMTLGGLALAVGILVDEAIVTLENIETHRAGGKSTARAALDATIETTAPRLLAMLCILVMFTPALFLAGPAKAMFLPLTLAVGAAMAASYILSSTLVPVLAVWFAGSRKGGFENPLAAWQNRYAKFLQTISGKKVPIIVGYAVGVIAVIFCLGGSLGTEIFPRARSNDLQIRFRAAAGTDIAGTESVFLKTLDVIGNTVGADNVESSLGFLGLHGSMYPINFLYQWSGGTEEGALRVRLKPGTPGNIEALKENLRVQFAQRIPEATFSFEPGGIVSEVMSLGAAAPVEVAVSGPNLATDRAFAEKVKLEMDKIRVLRDVQFAQSLDYPTVEVTVDRERSGIIGPTMNQVSRALVPATWSSRFEVPNYWADTASGVGYQVQIEIPQRLMASLEDVGNLPVMEQHGKSVLLRNIARIHEGTITSEYDRYNMQRTLTVRANIANEDLGSAVQEVSRAIQKAGTPPDRVHVTLGGQIVPMRELQHGLKMGLAVAVIGIFLLLMANFQSFKLSFVVLSTIPAALAGTVVALWLTNTTLNIQSLIGTIMGVGVAVANAILLVTFAERSRLAGETAAEASVEGARSRLRPILMTTTAMIAGTVPVALSLNDHTGQMAPLACAVIGGLVAATLATLFVLPAIFSVVQSRSHRRSVSLEFAVGNLSSSAD